MKKKLLLIALLGFILFNITGCFEDNKLEGSNMTTTTYPVEYLVTRLYGEHANITSIYPNGTSVSEYDLTEKQINNIDFSEVNYLFETIRMKSILSKQNCKCTVQSYKAVF